jgi:hypothetical protein
MCRRAWHDTLRPGDRHPLTRRSPAIFSPDCYRYDGNLSVLAALTADKLADPALVAEILAGPTPMEALVELCCAGLAKLVAAFAIAAPAFAYAPHSDVLDGEHWLAPPMR